MNQAPWLLVPCLGGRVDETLQLAASFWGSLLPAVWSYMLALRSRGLVSVRDERVGNCQYLWIKTRVLITPTLLRCRRRTFGAFAEHVPVRRTQRSGRRR
jgi:hypothetical protein